MRRTVTGLTGNKVHRARSGSSGAYAAGSVNSCTAGAVTLDKSIVSFQNSVLIFHSKSVNGQSIGQTL